MLRHYLAPLGTLTALLLYFFIFLSVKLTDSLPKPPSISKQDRLHVNLTQAWEDLHNIATGPHPYNSRRNDVVAEYLLERLEGVAGQYPDVEVVEDLVSNGTFTTTYFEGTNILVKIPGTTHDADKDAILFSAHYDSVSTSTGTVDDGIAIVCMLQLVQKFAKDRGDKTAIFNFNNGEEDWLNGAKAFMQHPWSNLTSTFLNLEGAASGGRPLLFRSTSLAPVKSFSRSVPHPHTSILAADAFAAGVIRSGTDYSVYANPSSVGSSNPRQMQGLDLAFYKGRSRYHTKYDAIPWLEGGTYRAVWGMLESAVGVGSELLTGNVRGNEESAVYFDLFGHATVAFAMNKLRIYNIVFLSVVPVIAILLSVCKRLVAPGGRDSYKFHLRWVRFWFALVLTAAAQFGLVALYKNFNPFVVYSYPYLTLFTSLALTYLTLYISLSVPLRFPDFITFRFSSSAPVIDPSEIKYRSTQPTSILLQLLILSYILLFVPVAILSGGENVGSIYPLSALLTCVLAGWVVGVGGEMLFGIYGDDGVEVKRQRIDGSGDDDEDIDEAQAYAEDGQQERRFVRGVVYEAPIGREGSSNTESTIRPTSPNWISQPTSNNGVYTAGGERETDPTEITPLLQQRREAGQPLTSLRLREEGVGKELARMIVWLLQFALVVPIPVILVSHIVIIMADGSSQSVVDGGGVGSIYASFSVLSLLLLLPLTPFFPAPSSLPSSPSKPKKNSKFPDTTSCNGTATLTSIIFILFVISALFTGGIFGLLSRALRVSEPYRPGFPFGVESPMKVYFQQQVEIRPNGNLVPSTQLTGVPYYMEKLVIPDLPSSHGEKAKKVACGEATGRGKGGEGLRRCAWEHDLLPWPGAHRTEEENSLLQGEAEWESWWDVQEVKAGARVPKNPYFRAKVSALPDGKKNLTRTISVEGRNTRNCRIYFDSPSEETPELAKVKQWRVRGGEGVGKELEGGAGEGVKEVRMWSRTWGREFVLDAELDGSDEGETLSGRVACEWTEYRSGLVEAQNEDVVGTDDEKGEEPSIPAYEEVLKYLPRWAVATKVADGLVEVWWKFEI